MTGKGWERAGNGWEGLGMAGNDWEGLGRAGKGWEGLGAVDYPAMSMYFIIID